MNILYVHTHDSGRRYDPYGYAVGTPAITELARRGTLFRQAYSAAPTCSPSRATLLTGCSPHRVGMLGLAHRGFRLNDYDEHLVRRCRRQVTVPRWWEFSMKGSRSTVSVTMKYWIDRAYRWRVRTTSTPSSTI